MEKLNIMKISNDRSLGEAIREWLKEQGLEQKLNEAKLLNSWDEQVGPMISRHTSKVYISRGRLFVKLDSPALKNELSYSREKLVKMLNEAVGADVIEEVIFI